jgi:hypothetical protein
MFAAWTGLVALLGRGAGEGLAGGDGLAACEGGANAGSAGANGALSVVWTAGEARGSGCARGCPRHITNNSAPTTIKATRMPIWTIFI